MKREHDQFITCVAKIILIVHEKIVKRKEVYWTGARIENLQ